MQRSWSPRQFQPYKCRHDWRRPTRTTQLSGRMPQQITSFNSSSLHSLTHKGHGRGAFGGGWIREEGAFGIQYCLVRFDPHGFHAYPSLPPLYLWNLHYAPHQTTSKCVNSGTYVFCIYSTYVCYIHSGLKITYSMQLKLTVWTVAQNKGVMNGHIYMHYYLMLPHTANYSHTQLT